MSARVKRLAWNDDSGFLCARTPFGKYQVIPEKNRKFTVCGSSALNFYRTHIDSEVEAQSACQSHYDKAVMALLEDEDGK